MPSADYFRRQAEVCLRLAASITTESMAKRLVELADRFRAKAEEADREQQLGQR